MREHPGIKIRPDPPPHSGNTGRSTLRWPSLLAVFVLGRIAQLTAMLLNTAV